MTTPAARPSRGRATIRSVAARAGVSRQTVSNALNSPERLTSETLAAVRAAIDELGYRPHEAGRSLTSRRTRIIAMSLGRTAHDPSASLHPLLRELVRSAARYGHRIVLLEGGADVHAELDAYADVWRRGAADGVVFADTCVGDVRPQWLTERGIPFAAMGRPWGEPDAPHHWIEIDGAAAMRSMVEHLLDRGHQRIAFIGWQSDNAGGDERISGWAGRLQEEGLEPDMLLHRAEVDAIDAGQRAAAALLRRDPTAIMCASDRLAVGASRALDDAGLVVGADVAVAGYDDSPLAVFNRPPLTSVRQPVNVVADFLVDTVVALTGGAPVEPPQPSRMVVPEIVPRASSSRRR